MKCGVQLGGTCLDISNVFNSNEGRETKAWERAKSSGHYVFIEFGHVDASCRGDMLAICVASIFAC